MKLAEPTKRALALYGLSFDDWHRLLDAQYGACYICEKRFTRGRPPVIDHDHRTGAVRGLLCNGCNTTLGYHHDRGRWFARAAAYLTDPPSAVLGHPRLHRDAPPQPTQKEEI